MKIAGKKIAGPNIQIVILPRGDGNLVFKAQAVLDYAAFEKLCPTPNPPMTMRPGSDPFRDVNNPDYLKKLDKWAEYKTLWMILESLKATEGLEWETVKPSEPDTWQNLNTELHDAGLTDYEIMRVMTGVRQAQGLDQEKIDEALKSFLAGQAAAQNP